MTLTNLIARVEAATGPDRAIDVLIFSAIGAPVPIQFANKMIALVFDDAEQCYFAPIGDMRVRYEPPAYTASLDAAMTLVPKDFHATICGANDAWHVMLNPTWVGSKGFVSAFKRSLIIALCAAALRAIEAGDQRG